MKPWWYEIVIINIPKPALWAYQKSLTTIVFKCALRCMTLLQQSKIRVWSWYSWNSAACLAKPKIKLLIWFWRSPPHIAKWQTDHQSVLCFCGPCSYIEIFTFSILWCLNLTRKVALCCDIYSPYVPVSSHSLIQEGDNGASSSWSVKRITIKCFPLRPRKFIVTDPIISPSV